jgi:hypothetical protein
LKESLFNERYHAYYEDDGEDDALEHDGGDYLPPKGWCKFALHTRSFQEDWGICFHGTTASNLADIVEVGELRAPGSKTRRGSVRRRPGHKSWDEPNIFTSITPRYASLYAMPHEYNDKYYQVMLMLRQDRSHAHSIENTRGDLWDLDIRLDRNVSNTRIGYYTRHQSSLQLYAVLVKEHEYHPHNNEQRGELGVHRRKRLREEAPSDDDSDLKHPPIDYNDDDDDVVDLT